MAERLAGLILLLAIASCRPSASVKGSQDLSGPDQMAYRITRILSNDQTGPEEREYILTNYPKLVNSWENQATRILDSDSRFRWDRARELYLRLESINSRVRNSEVYSELLTGVSDYGELIREIEESGAGQKYSEALEILEDDTRESAKTAYFLLRNLEHYHYRVPGLDSAIELARSRANINSVFLFHRENETNIPLYELDLALQQLLIGTGITGPFVTMQAYDIDDMGHDADHLAEIGLREVSIGNIEISEYSQDVAGSDIAYRITEESMDISLVFQTTITDLGLNRVLDRSETRLERKLENLIGTFPGEPELLNDYQVSILNRPSLSADSLPIRSLLNEEFILKLAEDIRDFYQDH